MATIDLAKKHKIEILLAGMQIPPNYGHKYTQAFKRAFREIAEKKKIKRMPFLLKDVGGEVALNQPDGIHPNSEGYAIIFKNVASHLDPILKKLLKQKNAPIQNGLDNLLR